MIEKEGVYRGHRYRVSLNETFGYRCGYVVANGDINRLKIDDLRVHGGITWRNRHFPDGNNYSGNLPVFGFDCAHYGDWTPYSPFGHCWEVDEVVKECKSLIDQLIEIEE